MSIAFRSKASESRWTYTLTTLTALITKQVQTNNNFSNFWLHFSGTMSRTSMLFLSLSILDFWPPISPTLATLIGKIPGVYNKPAKSFWEQVTNHAQDDHALLLTMQSNKNTEYCWRISQSHAVPTIFALSSVSPIDVRKLPRYLCQGLPQLHRGQMEWGQGILWCFIKELYRCYNLYRINQIQPTYPEIWMDVLYV